MNGLQHKIIAVHCALLLLALSSLPVKAMPITNNTHLGCMACHETQAMQTDNVPPKNNHSHSHKHLIK